MTSPLCQALMEVITAVAPLTIAVASLGALFLDVSWTDLARIAIGASFAAIGLLFFLRGTRIALLPMGEIIGASLPARSSPALLVITAFVFSFSVTIADPSLHVLTAQVASLQDSSLSVRMLGVMISSGMGFLVTVAMLRIVLNIPSRLLFIAGYSIAILLSFFTVPELAPLFFDSGSAATGPMVVPCVIALGLGTASVLQRKRSLADEFGLVGLATLGPVLVMMVWGVIVRWTR
ncbi:MAG: DUF1538 domain-containing protein [Clostridia bacterium]|nr:DUF1538 domain-containing protein [Clostridia bacterium]